MGNTYVFRDIDVLIDTEDHEPKNKVPFGIVESALPS